MAIKKKRARRGNAVTVNFSGVESGGRKCPDGEYEAEISEAELEESSTGNPMIVAKWKISKGKFKGVTLYDNISLVPQALWKLRTLLEALGIEPQEEDVEASEYASAMVGESSTILVTNETFEGEQRPKVTGYGSAGEAAEEEDEEDEEEEPKVRNKAGKKPAKDDEEEEEEEDDDDDEEEEEKPVRKGVKSKIKEGSRVKFEDDDGNVVKGTVTSLDDGQATVEDKNGDEYEIDAKHLTSL